MQTRIFVLLFVFLLAAVSPTFAGDLKPFEGWSQTVDWIYINPLDYPYLEEILIENASWTPLFVYGQLITAHGHTNVGGKTTSEAPQLVYIFATGPEEDDPIMGVLIGYTTMTVANGDKIYSEWQSVFYEGHGLYMGKASIVGGTGRFEGATGSLQFMPGSIKNGQPAMILEGYIETVGKAKEE